MARHEASGLSGDGFCEAEGIGRSAFWRWRRRLSDEDAARTGDGGGAAFVELSAAQSASWDVDLELGASVVLRVRRPACTAERRIWLRGADGHAALVRRPGGAGVQPRSKRRSRNVVPHLPFNWPTLRDSWKPLVGLNNGLQG